MPESCRPIIFYLFQSFYFFVTFFLSSWTKKRTTWKWIKWNFELKLKIKNKKCKNSRDQNFKNHLPSRVSFTASFHRRSTHFDLAQQPPPSPRSLQPPKRGRTKLRSENWEEQTPENRSKKPIKTDCLLRFWVFCKSPPVRKKNGKEAVTDPLVAWSFCGGAWRRRTDTFPTVPEASSTVPDFILRPLFVNLNLSYFINM